MGLIRTLGASRDGPPWERHTSEANFVEGCRFLRHYSEGRRFPFFGTSRPEDRLLSARCLALHAHGIMLSFKSVGALDTVDDPQVGRNLVKDFLMRCTPLILHATTVSYTPDAMDISSVSGTRFDRERASSVYPFCGGPPSRLRHFRLTILEPRLATKSDFSSQTIDVRGMWRPQDFFRLVRRRARQNKAVRPSFHPEFV